jgi:hypothetical protein
LGLPEISPANNNQKCLNFFPTTPQNMWEKKCGKQGIKKLSPKVSQDHELSLVPS